jgi:hypothetical protein
LSPLGENNVEEGSGGMPDVGRAQSNATKIKRKAL